MERKIFEPEHDRSVRPRAVSTTECAPHAAEWERNGITAREPWLRAGELGLLGWEAPEKFGGQDVKDFRYNAIMTEEMGRPTGTVGIGIGLQNDIMASVPRRAVHRRAEARAGCPLLHR